MTSPAVRDAVMVAGGRPLAGEVPVDGCKISTVTMIAASLLTDDAVVLENVPDLLDTRILVECLGMLGAAADREGGALRLVSKGVRSSPRLPEAVVASVHGPLYLLPALLVRNGMVSYPRAVGGCPIGTRPVVHVLRVLRAFGAKLGGGPTIRASLGPQGLMGADVDLDKWYGPGNNKFISGATKTAILAGVCARGETTIKGAYWRSPIVHFCRFLRSMGASIEGEGTRSIRIQGRPSLHGTRFRVPFDRLVLGTYVAAAAVTRGRVACLGADMEGWEAEAEAFRRAGVRLSEEGGAVVAEASGAPGPLELSTEVVDTDLGPLFATMMSLAPGCHSTLEEVVWENRFRYAVELRRMGGINRIRGQTLHITGVDSLRPATVQARDLRGAAALLLAALSCPGISRVQGAEHLARGYADLPGRLRSLRADLTIGGEP
jgi:UDP-N-acetylglucosamine 1-carboxyvinyltransferase